ncbi:MAG TPA: TolC family protein, partial [Candidatus Angelobacter sp.]
MNCGYRLFTVLLILVAGCKVGPNYKRPKVDTPSVYRADAQAAQGISIAEEKWNTVFQDPELQQLIHEALAENYDVRIAASRILQAQAVLGITRADQLPTVTAAASATSQRIPETIVGPAANTSASVASLSLFWELDFWGKFRRATEAARANLLATEWGQRAVVTSLVSSVASAYYQLRELDLEMDISRQTLATRQESLRLVKVRQQGG